MYAVYTVCGLLAVLLVCGAQENTAENKCVSSYEEFLKETFNNSSEKRYNLHLYQAIYPQNGHLSYVVYITYWVLPPTFTFCNNISRWHGAVKLSKSININLHISAIIIIKIILDTINFYLYIFSINIYITQNRKL